MFGVAVRNVRPLCQRLHMKLDQCEHSQPASITLLCLGLHWSPLVLDVAAVFICAVLLLMEQQDGGAASRLSELQLLSLSRGQLLQPAVLLLSFPGELDQRRKHV